MAEIARSLRTPRFSRVHGRDATDGSSRRITQTRWRAADVCLLGALATERGGEPSPPVVGAAVFFG